MCSLERCIVMNALSNEIERNERQKKSNRHVVAEKKLVETKKHRTCQVWTFHTLRNFGHVETEAC